MIQNQSKANVKTKAKQNKFKENTINNKAKQNKRKPESMSLIVYPYIRPVLPEYLLALERVWATTPCRWRAARQGVVGAV